MTDTGLVQLAELKNLGILNLDDTAITDAGLEHLRGLPKLTTLLLERTKVTAEGSASFRRQLLKSHCSRPQMKRIERCATVSVGRARSRLQLRSIGTESGDETCGFSQPLRACNGGSAWFHGWPITGALP